MTNLRLSGTWLLCPLLAQSGHSLVHCTCPLSGKSRGGHADSPVRTLYYHAIELYLKALLRQHYRVDELQNKFRHNIKRMRAKAEKSGLSLMDEDREVLALMKGDVLIRARYIRTGFFNISDTRSVGSHLQEPSTRHRQTVAKSWSEGALLRWLTGG